MKRILAYLIIVVIGWWLLLSSPSNYPFPPKLFEGFPDKVTLNLAKPRRIPILLYHYVEIISDERDTIRQSLNIDPHIFEQQIIGLKEAGFQFITPRKLDQSLKDTTDTKYLILSFDDGYRTFYEYVFPILKKHNISAVNYVIAGVLNKPNYLFDWQIQEMHQSGLVEIGLHGDTHQDITTLSNTEATRQLKLGLDIFEKLTGERSVSYAYPYGGHDAGSEKILKEVGITNAVTIKQGVIVEPDNIYQIPRVRPGRATGDALIQRIEFVSVE
jgi:peptidoglycan/xylan/chitin deacetylase (PgdA/CDA1 family)